MLAQLGKELKVVLTLNEEMLGMMPGKQNIYEEFIAANAPDSATRMEEIEENGIEETVAKGRTYFPKLENGNPFLWDYQVKGMFKDAFGMLRRVPGSECGKRKAYKKEIDGLLFVYPRKIPIIIPEGEEMSFCERPLRASTPQGDRVALASSETVPAGSELRFTIQMMDPSMEKAVREVLEYGEMRGLGQWRNSGKGVFSTDYEE